MGRHPLVNAATVEAVSGQGSAPAAARYRRRVGTARRRGFHHALAFRHCGVDRCGGGNDCRSDRAVGAMARRRTSGRTVARPARDGSRSGCDAAAARDPNAEFCCDFTRR